MCSGEVGLIASFVEEKGRYQVNLTDKVVSIRPTLRRSAGSPVSEFTCPRRHVELGTWKIHNWVWVKMKPPGDRRFWSMFPLTRVPFWVYIFDPPPTGLGNLNKRYLEGASGISMLLQSPCWCLQCYSCECVWPLCVGCDVALPTEGCYLNYF